MPRLSIVIPTLGRSTTLADVLAALATQRPPMRGVEVIVAVDGSSPTEDPTKATRAPSLDPAVVRASIPGASAARNAGWRAAASPLVLFLDDDIVPSDRLVAEHLEWHDAHPDPRVAVLGAVRWSRRVRVTPFMRWLEMGVQFDYGTIEGTETEWQRFYSCNVSVKRSLLEDAGGFDEQRFPFGYEDLELSRRLSSEHGLRLLYNRDAVGEHLKRETIETWKLKLPRIATAERRFTQLYPSERPYFYDRFHAAANAPEARGRSARLARFVPPELPFLGPVVWRSFDMVCAQELAPHFLASWEDLR